MTRQFDVVVEQDSEGFFVATVPALPGCHTQAKSLDELMVRVREAIELCDLQGLSQAEFARLKGLSLPAAKSRVQRARQRMRERMAQGCQVSFDPSGRVDDFVPRAPLMGPVPVSAITACASPKPCDTP